MTKTVARALPEMNYAGRIRESFDVSRSYHNLFPLVEGLRTKEDTRGFIEGYVEVMRGVVQQKIERGDQGAVFDETRVRVQNGEWTLDDAARDLAADNLAMLSSVYWANTGKKVQRSWDNVLDEVCSE